MSKPFRTKEILDELSSRILGDFTGSTVKRGKSSLPVPASSCESGYFNISLNTIVKVAALATTIRYRYSFLIVGRFKYPTAATDLIEDEKSDRASEMYDAIITGVDFGGIGDKHDIEAVSFEDLEDVSDKVYTVNCVFEIECSQDRL